MKIEQFGMDTISLAGSLPAKLRAMREAGFAQVMLSARDLTSHPEGWEAAVRTVKDSGLRATGFQVLRDFEGLSGDLHDYKVAIAKSMIEMCAALGSKVLLVCSSTSTHASGEIGDLARDLRKLATLAIPYGVKIAYEALSWGRSVNRSTQAWDLICEADCANLGIGIDSFHLLAAQDDLDELELLDPQRVYLAQLSDFMWRETPTFEERMTTARTFRVFPGEGVHSPELAKIVTVLDRIGYRGDYSFEVFNDDYQQLPQSLVAERARRAAVWLSEDVLRRSVPLPGAMRLAR